jgi:hypothetical protein
MNEKRYTFEGRVTVEESSLMYDIRDEWINLFFDNVKEGRGIDKAAFENGIEWLYKTLLKREKPEIIYCDSLKEWVNTSRICRDKYQDHLRSSVTYCNKIRTYGTKSYRDKRSFEKNDVCKKIIQAGINEELVNRILFPLEMDVIDNFLMDEDRNKRFENFSYNHSVYEWGMLAKYDYHIKTGSLNHSPFLKNSISLAKACALAADTYSGCVLAIQPPVHISRNASGRLHSMEGPAVRFRDGSSHYFIEGRNIPAWIFEKKDIITQDRFLTEKNAEMRAAMYSVVDQKHMLQMLGAKTVHTSEIRHANGDIETVELLKTRNKFPDTGNQPFAWVKVTCPSTGTDYLLGVEPKYENAAEALTSLSMFDKNEYSFDFRT